MQACIDLRWFSLFMDFLIFPLLRAACVVVCKLLPVGNFLLLLTTIHSLIPSPLPPFWCRQPLTADLFQRCFFTTEAKNFLSPIKLSLEMGGGSRLWGCWFSFFVFLFSAISNFGMLKRQESEAGLRLRWNTPFVPGILLPSQKCFLQCFIF